MIYDAYLRRAWRMCFAGILSAFLTTSLYAAPPSVWLTYPTNPITVQVGESLTIYSSATDEDGNLTNHNIDYLPPGSGSFQWYSGGGGDGFSSNRSQAITFTTAGEWRIRAAASDGSGWEHSNEVSIYVNQRATASVNSPASTTVTKNASLWITSTATDAEGNIINHNIDIRRPSGVWNYDSGQSWASGSPYQGGYSGSGSYSYKSAYFTFSEVGTWWIRAAVEDQFGFRHSSIVFVEVTAPPAAWVDYIQGTLISSVAQPSAGTAASQFRFAHGTTVTFSGWALPGFKIAICEGQATLVEEIIPATDGSWTASLPSLSAAVHHLTINAYQSAAEPAGYNYLGSGAQYSHTHPIAVEWQATPSAVSLISPTTQTIGRTMSVRFWSSSTSGGARTGHRLRYKKPGGDWQTLGDEGNSDTKDTSLEFDTNGVWLLKAEVKDSSSVNWTSSEERQITVEPAAWINSVTGPLGARNINTVTRPSSEQAAADFQYRRGTSIILTGWVYDGYGISVSGYGGAPVEGQLGATSGGKRSWSTQVVLGSGLRGLTVTAYKPGSTAIYDAAGYDYSGMAPSFLSSNEEPLAIEGTPWQAAWIDYVTGLTIHDQSPGHVFSAQSGTGVELKGWALNGFDVQVYQVSAQNISTYLTTASLNPRNADSKDWTASINLPAGQHSIKIMASNGTDTEGASYDFSNGVRLDSASDYLKVRWRELPKVRIDSPADIAVGVGTTVIVASTATAGDSGLASHGLQVRNLADGQWQPFGGTTVPEGLQSVKDAPYTFAQSGFYEVRAFASDGAPPVFSAVRTVQVVNGGPSSSNPIYWVNNRTFTYPQDNPAGVTREILRPQEEIWAGPNVLVKGSHNNAGGQAVLPAKVTFESGRAVRLLPGFRAEKDATFKAKVSVPLTQVYIAALSSEGSVAAEAGSSSSNQRPTIVWSEGPTRAKLGQAFSVRATASDGNGNLESILIFRDGANVVVEAVPSGSGESYQSSPISFTPSVPGNVRFTARAKDRAGATSALAELVVAVDWSDAATPPTVAGVSSGSAAIPGAGILVGTLGGAFSVDNRGAANYSIPLPIPPGRGGVQPSLSINYNSEGGNGPLGVGVSLSTGFPRAITRGRTILARDSVVRGVTFDQVHADKLYLDGKRLLCVSGEEGKPGSTYRTEVDSFITVTAFGGGDNIEGFRVNAKDGLAMYFGRNAGDATNPSPCPNETDAYHAPDAEAKALTWALKWAEDTVGNYVKFHYTDFGAGEHLLTSIDYTGNRAPVVGPGFTVWLRHDLSQNLSGIPSGTPRPDASTIYQAGRSTKFSARLDEIAISPTGVAADAAPRAFRLKYDVGSGNSTLLRLTEVVQREASGSLPPTKLEWPSPELKLTPATSTFAIQVEGGNMDSYRTKPGWIGDFNADGKSDILFSRSSDSGVRLAWRADSGGLTHQDAPVDGGHSVLVGMRLATTGDFNGDGRSDLVWARAGLANGGWFVSFAKRDSLGFSSPVRVAVNGPETQGNITPESALAVDLDGDGVDELLFQARGAINAFSWLGSSDGTEWDEYTILIGGPQVNSTSVLLPGGRLHLARYTPSSGLWTKSDLSIPNSEDRAFSLRRIDFDGDGRTDLLATEVKTEPLANRAAMVWETYAVRNTGSGVFSPPELISDYSGTVGDNLNRTNNSTYSTLIGDMNGDGLEDILILSRGLSPQNTLQGGWSVGLSRGDGTFNFTGFVGIGLKANIGDVAVDTYNVQSGTLIISQGNPDSPGDYYISSLDGYGLSGVVLMDVNGDGRKDFVWNAPGKGWHSILAGRSGFDLSAPIPLFGAGVADSNEQNYLWPALDGQSPYFAADPVAFDACGNGRESLLVLFPWLNPGGSADRVALSDPSAIDQFLAAGITNGFGSKLRIGYGAISDDSIYSTGTTVGYPIRETRRKKVVSDIWKDAGGNFIAGEWAHFSYQYSGARLDLSGRGFLGFHSFVTLDHQTGLFKYQFLAQSFPMTGLTHREETYRWWPDGESHRFRFLSSHNNTVVFDRVDGGGGSLWPFISNAVQSRWEDAAVHHFEFPAMSSISQPEALFPEAKPEGAHITITAQSTFDLQASPQLELPTVAGFSPSDATSTGVNAVAGTITAHSKFADLPGKIQYGNLRKLSTDYGAGFSEMVEMEYKPVTANGLSGLVSNVQTSVVSPGYGTEDAPVKSYTYWTKGVTPTPLVESETVTSSDARLTLTTTAVRDNLGRVTETKIAAPGDSSIGNYTVSSVLEFDGRFDLPKKTRNAASYEHETSTTYDSFLGLPTSVTDVNLARVTTGYDALGRLKTTLDVNTNLSTDILYSYDTSQTVTPPVAGNGIVLRSFFKTETTSTVKPKVTTYYDRLGRAIRTVKEGYSGQVKIDTAYDILGQVVATSLPYTSGQQKIHWTKTYYDRLGRVAEVVSPNDTVTTSKYRGRLTQVTVDASHAFGASGDTNKVQTNSTLVDARGRTVRVWNADNPPQIDNGDGAASPDAPTASIEFELDGFGRMRKTKLRDGSQITATYDDLGRQITLHDPSKGPWEYRNNALGQVVWQKDARGTETASTFDRLGRPLTRTTTEPAGAGGAIETARWYYYDSATDSARHLVAKGSQGWIGALQREESSTVGAPGYAAANSETGTVNYYDSLGRPSINLTTVDGKWFYTYTEYDAYSRVKSLRYNWRPAGVEHPEQSPYAWQDFGVSYFYDGGDSLASKSYLINIKDSLGRDWWDSPTYDYADRVTTVRKGSGHVTTRAYRPEDGLLMSIHTGSSGTPVQNLAFNYDGLGNLVWRSAGEVSETLTYDTLNRLRTSTKQGETEYHDNGNIKSKPNVGKARWEYAYGDSARPHQVTSAWGYTMGYDANGNISSRTGHGELWSFRYAGFDKPRWMAKITSGAVLGSEFLYNANRSRTVHLEFTQLDGANTPGGYVRKRVYGFGGAFEINYKKAAAAAEWGMDRIRIYVSGPDGTIGAREFENPVVDGGTEKALVYHHDHLGSIDVITPFGSAAVAANDGAGKPGRFSEDAWGQRRDPVTWTGVPTTTDDGGFDSLSPRGFTGHEMLDDLGLIHMNGRVYDPLLGRMLSADILVQYPDDLQAYNRYTYVLNNPLSFTDPSGFKTISDYEKEIEKNRAEISKEREKASGSLWGALKYTFSPSNWARGAAIVDAKDAIKDIETHASRVNDVTGLKTSARDYDDESHIYGLQQAGFRFGIVPFATVGGRIVAGDFEGAAKDAVIQGGLYWMARSAPTKVDREAEISSRIAAAYAEGLAIRQARFRLAAEQSSLLVVNKAQANGATSGVGAALATDAGVFEGLSIKAGGGELHPAVAAAYEAVPMASRSPYHGYCAEGRAVSSALEARAPLSGGRMMARDVRAVGKPTHGAVKDPCSSCQGMMRNLGIAID